MLNSGFVSPAGRGETPRDGKGGRKDYYGIWTCVRSLGRRSKQEGSAPGWMLSRSRAKAKVGPCRRTEDWTKLRVQLAKPQPSCSSQERAVGSLMDAGPGSRLLGSAMATEWCGFLIFFVFLPFLGPHPPHMEVPRLGV